MCGHNVFASLQVSTFIIEMARMIVLFKTKALSVRITKKIKWISVVLLLQYHLLFIYCLLILKVHTTVF